MALIMLLSSHQEYRTAVLATADGDLDTARSNFELLAQIAEDEGDTVRLSYILQMLGDVEARAGNLDIGHAYHRRAVGLCPNIPLVLLHYANGLRSAFNSPGLASDQINAAERLLNSKDWDTDADNISRSWYTRRIAELRDADGMP